MKVYDVKIEVLAKEQKLDVAFEVNDGFCELLPVEISKIAAGASVAVLGGAGDWLTVAVHDETPVGPLGCYFVKDIRMCGHGYLFSGSRFVKEDGHTSIVAHEWLEREDLADNPLMFKTIQRRLVDKPVLCLIGPGYPIYGHWLVDYMPRVRIAQAVLGKAFSDFRIPLPDDAPPWLIQFICELTGAETSQFIAYNRMMEELEFAFACIPTFPHDSIYNFHPFFRNFYREISGREPWSGQRRLCLSRKNFEVRPRSLWRVFNQRHEFEELAVERGFDVVFPEELSIQGQISLFRSASVLVGEFGSGLHNSVYMRPNARVGSIGDRNGIQTKICSLFGQSLFYMNRITDTVDEHGIIRTTANTDDLIELLDKVIL